MSLSSPRLKLSWISNVPKVVYPRRVPCSSVYRVAAGQLQEAQPLLAAATDMLANNKQSSEVSVVREQMLMLTIIQQLVRLS